jgi:hypothetical protein
LQLLVCCRRYKLAIVMILTQKAHSFNPNLYFAWITMTMQWSH